MWSYKQEIIQINYGHLFTHPIFIKVTDQAGKNEEIEVIKTNQSRSIKESGMTEVLSLINIQPECLSNS